MLFEFVTGLSRQRKGYIFAALDFISVYGAFLIALLLFSIPPQSSQALSDLLPATTALAVSAVAFSYWLGLPHMTLNAFEARGLSRAALMSALLGALGLLAQPLFGLTLSGEVYLVFMLAMAFVSVGARVALRHITLWIYRTNTSRLRVLVYGAGQTGQQLVAALRTDDKIMPIAFVDDNPTLQSTMISGLEVHATSGIKDLVVNHKIDRVVLAMPSLGQPRQSRIAHTLREMGCEVHALPSFAELVGSKDIGRNSTPVALDALLGRNGLEAELPGVTEAYSGNHILITGAGGSIGSELCRQLIACRPSKIVLLDHSELALYCIDKELRELSVGLEIVPVLGSVTDAELVKSTLRAHGIDVVLHAAAYKHLPLVQINPLAGLDNNVFGTKIVADAAREMGVQRFILVSSDKAVRPTNVMGASKRLAELVVQDLATRSSGTMFSMVRFGNVLGSSGSVIPLFEEQIARGGPVTLTHGAVTRYFMTISEAARLVLLAGSFARGGDVFVLDMGEPVPIKRLARQMIEGAGLTVRDIDNPQGDIEIQITGLRDGEKLHEELLISPDMLTTPHNKILRAQESYLSEIEMATALKDLSRALSARETEAAMKVIARWVESGGDPEAQVAAQ